MTNVHITPIQSPLMTAAAEGADAESMVMMESIDDARQRRTTHRQARQSATQTMVSAQHRAADKLKELASERRDKALVSGIIDIGTEILGAVASVKAGQAGRAGAQVLGKLAHGIHNMVVAGDEEDIKVDQKRAEIRAEFARQEVDQHRDLAAEGQQAVSGSLQQLQRFSELTARGADAAANAGR